MYADSTVYIVGNAKTNCDNAIMAVYKGFYVGFVVELESGRIVDVSCLSTLRTTDEFVRSLFVGKTLGLECGELEAEVRRRYHGSSQKAIMVAFKDAAKTLADLRKRSIGEASPGPGLRPPSDPAPG